MSKLNIGVGEEFPLGDAPQNTGDRHGCGHRGRHGHHRRHGARAAGAVILLPAAAASVTAAILYPLATLGIIGGLGVAAAAHRHSRWAAYRDVYRDAYRARQERAGQSPGDTPPTPPKENA